MLIEVSGNDSDEPLVRCVSKSSNYRYGCRRADPLDDQIFPGSLRMYIRSDVHFSGCADSAYWQKAYCKIFVK